jgi:DsbC/DsbD-like thiol-disulfide interchange protein
MNQQTRLILSLLTCCFVANEVSAAENHVKATLLANVSAIHTPKPFSIGLLLEIEPGWHIYWSNPGDAGLATAVKFKLPDGFKIVADPFPIPRRFQQPGNVVAYGYETAVLITAQVTPPDNLHIGEEVTFDAAANWLACKDECMPGKASATLTLKVLDHAGPANVSTFERYATTVTPVGNQSPDVTEIKSSLDRDAHVVSIAIRWKNAVSGIEIFPGQTGSATLSHFEAKKTENDVALITFKIESAADQSLPDEARVLIAYREGTGAQKGFETTIQLK